MNHPSPSPWPRRLIRSSWKCKINRTSSSCHLLRWPNLCRQAFLNRLTWLTLINYLSMYLSAVRAEPFKIWRLSRRKLFNVKAPFIAVKKTSRAAQTKIQALGRHKSRSSCWNNALSHFSNLSSVQCLPTPLMKTCSEKLNKVFPRSTNCAHLLSRTVPIRTRRLLRWKAQQAKSTFSVR